MHWRERFAAQGLARPWLALFALLSLFALIAEAQFERAFRQQVGLGLHTVVDTTVLALEGWSRFERANAAGWAADGNVRRAAAALAGQPAAALRAHPSLAVLREELQSVVSNRGYVDFMLVATDGRVLAAGASVAVGRQLPREAGVESFLAQVVAQGDGLSRPFLANVGPGNGGIPTVLVGARVEREGRVFGVLTFAIDLRREFLAHLRQAEIGLSGETFGIDAEGRMVGASRFEAQLWSDGLLPAGVSSLLRLRVPGTGRPTVPAASAATGGQGEELNGFRDYRGVEVVGTWRWSQELGMGFVTKQDRAEAYRHVFWLRFGLGLLCIGFGALMILPVRLLTAKEVAAGDQALREEVLESSPLGAAVTDIDGRVRFVNSGMSVILGASRETLMATPSYHWYVYPEARAPLIAEVRAGRAVRDAEVELRRSDGVNFPARVALLPLVDRHRFVVWVEDMTGQKQIEAKLALAGEQAERASRMKSEFLANMSHEIRTPINAVLNLNRLALEDTQLAPKSREYLEKSLLAAEMLLVLVNDVLDLSKVEAGRLDLEMQPFQLPRVVAQVAGMFGERAQAKGLALSVAMAPGMTRTLVGDPVRLGQVLSNLLGNAVKFTERGGVELFVEQVDGDASHVVLRFSVRDSGIGIAPEAVGRLFEPFGQADTSISRRYGGTGLGLAICRQLVVRMGGTIDVDSQPGLGSTFVFTAVFAVDAEADGGGAVESVVDTAALAGRRVLVAEDNPVNRLIVSEYLERVGVRADCVEDGQAALDRLRDAKEPFDAVLMDVQMPVLDGISATRAMRADTRTAALPVIAVTAGALVEERQRCIEAGMNACVTKPYRPETLYRALLDCLDGTEPSVGHDAVAEPAAAPAQDTAVQGAVLAPVDAADGDFDARALLLLAPEPATRRRFADLYAESLAKAARELDAIVATRNAAALRTLAHSLKSSSLTMGANAIGKLLVQVERLAESDVPAAFALAGQLHARIGQAQAWLAARDDFEREEQAS